MPLALPLGNCDLGASPNLNATTCDVVNGVLMWADNETELDLLGFDFLVDSLIVALTEPRLLPLTVGVLGDWGSGKSSLMRMAAADLREITAPLEEESPDQPPKEPRSRYLTVEFSPWQYEDYEDVKVALMNTVLVALSKRAPDESAQISRLRTYVKRLRRWGRRAGRVGTSSAPALVSVVMPDADPGLLDLTSVATGAVAKEIGPMLEESDDASESLASSAEIDDIGRFRNEFKKLVLALPDTDAVVVFIDDLDRCLPETIVDTFEAIRLFLNTPHTAYVLALNQLVVESAIDSRYPELKKSDGGGIGRDYLEKMLQMKVVIPPLSAPEAETYVNLLFADLHLPPEDFETVLAKTHELRAQAGLAVTFNTGVAGEALGDIPTALAADLDWAANISPVLAPSLRGNPRQLKRFLNNLLLKHHGAKRRGVVLELPVLAKLMVLEDQYNSDFQKLFDWQLAATGPIPELAASEAHARMSRDQDGAGESNRGRETGSKKAAKSASAKAETKLKSEEQPTRDIKVWASKPHISEWLRVNPPLGPTDLRPYFMYSRDKLSFGVSASRLSPKLQRLLGQVQSDVAGDRRGHYVEVAALEPAERAQLMEALLERVLSDPRSTALDAALEIAERQPDVVQVVCESLSRVPPASLPPRAASASVRRLPVEHPAVVDLLDGWAASDHEALKGLLQQARRARKA